MCFTRSISIVLILHRNMVAIHSKGTKPEIIVRKYLFSKGFRYRVNVSNLPGRPDIVQKKYRTCIFINECFWHRHQGCKYFVLPKSNIEFWSHKINRNIERDKEIKKELSQMGWNCITIWECEIKSSKRQMTLDSLVYTLNLIYLKDRCIKHTGQDDNTSLQVAEP